MAEKTAQVSSSNTVIVPKERDAINTHTLTLDEVAPYSHEKADTMIFVRVRNAAEEGSKVIMVKASDSDVLVVSVSVFPGLQEHGLHQLCIEYGQGRNLRWIPVHDICLSVGREKNSGFLFFMHLLAVTLGQPSVVKERKLIGKPERYVAKLLTSSPNSASTNQEWMMRY